MKDFNNGMMPDVGKVLAVHLSAVGLTLTHLELGLKILGLGLSAGYIAWKWYAEYNEKNK